MRVFDSRLARFSSYCSFTHNWIERIIHICNIPFYCCIFHSSELRYLIYFIFFWVPFWNPKNRLTLCVLRTCVRLSVKTIFYKSREEPRLDEYETTSNKQLNQSLATLIRSLFLTYLLPYS